MSYRFITLLPLLLAPCVAMATTPNTASPTIPFCAEISITRIQQKADGIELTERYRERMFRTDRVIAFERLRPNPQISPALAHDTAEHSHHSHPDGMVRRYEQLADGSVAYSLFNDQARQEIRLQPHEFADFGFDGDFTALHTLVDATTRKKLGATDQHLREPGRELRWSGRDHIIRYQQQTWATGSETMTVTPTGQCTDPRASRQSFTSIDYADTLD